MSAGRCIVTLDMGTRAADLRLALSLIVPLSRDNSDVHVARVSFQWSRVKPINLLRFVLQRASCWDDMRVPVKRWATLLRSSTWSPIATPILCVESSPVLNTPYGKFWRGKCEFSWTGTQVLSMLRGLANCWYPRSDSPALCTRVMCNVLMCTGFKPVWQANYYLLEQSTYYFPKNYFMKLYAFFWLARQRRSVDGIWKLL